MPCGFLGTTATDTLTPTGGTDWNNWTLATAQTSTGTAMFLWNRTTGALYLWSDISYNPDTAQFSYTSSRVLAASGWNTGASVALQAADVNKDGVPDLWTVGAGAVTTLWLVTDLQAASATITAQPKQNLITSDHTWQFDDMGDGNVATAEDVTGGKALGVEGSNVMWRSDDLFSPALVMNVDSTGTVVETSGKGALATNQVLVDTTKSFSISVWAKPTSAGGVIVSEDGANASRFLLWNNASDNTWRFGLGNADSGWSYTQVVTPAGTALGVWTHLVATYNAETRTISLYVNGALKGSAQYTATPTWPSTGKFVVGRYLYQGVATAHYAGMLSNLQVWKRALTPTQIGASNNDSGGGSLIPFGATTWTPPGTGTAQTDVYAADPNGNLWRYRKPISTPELVSTGWNQFTSFGVADMDHDGYQDLVVRDNTSCNLQVFLGGSGDISPTPTFFGAQWCNYRPFGVADYNRDGYQDVFTAGPTNDLWVYPGDLAGGKLSRIDVGDGWSTDYVGYGVADVVGDGTPDLYGRQTSTGQLRLYNFPAGTAGITQVGIGWGGYTSFGLTDYDRDGKPDVIARENSTGILWLYPGAANGMLAPRTQIAVKF
ncbi:FG-GAP-like repeat-containing protein [Micromonospora yasonensis]|uniref:LamG-like jellyroll fold domain-containing protein n=1 Tax=Micromonospora yasonensis TaxID=1128667 RepID=UPI002230AECA|nr:LamG-like jellyroll fold domain-containing protein [Micromonospora yasonensis]MCW3845079.1 FG-GAP-like repeat-containing protein [Micromonospora yasonensis]